MTKRRRVVSTIREMTLSPREKLIRQIMSSLDPAKIRELVIWSLEVQDAAQEFAIGEAEGLPQFIRRLGAGLRAACAKQGHVGEGSDPRCLRCGEPNAGYVPPAGQADETLPLSKSRH